MAENTKIVQCFLPAMTAGIYSTKVQQRLVKDNANLLDVEKTFDFGVDAARFTINSNDIYSVYPPTNKSGTYSESLPHLVFTRKTLPWERTIDGKLPLFQRDETPVEKRNPQDSPPVPWMALLLFDEEEMKNLQISKNTIAALVQPNLSDGIIRPEIFDKNTTTQDVLKLMEWEKVTDGCFTIELTKEQFEKNVPSMDSLSFLAHAKEVSITDKDKAGITDLNDDGAGVFSVIVGNRLPSKGKQNTAILVSLEGFTAYLKGANPMKKIPSEHKARLAVLASWNFIDDGELSFSQLIDSVEIKSMKVQRKEEASDLVPFFDSGYIPIEHLTRTGASTLSWYHGPLVPKLFPASTKNISFSTSDAALRYDKTTGFFDISFAAAWQLGRILALQNQEFSKTILNWRITQNQLEAGKEKEESINVILSNTDGADLKDKVIRYLGQLNELEIPISTEKTSAVSEEIPKTVQHFLNDLYQLKGIPFPYLVPHELLLEKEHEAFTGTLSLFYVDPNWVEALLDGALSIGRIQNNDTLLQLAINGEFITGYNTQSIVIDEKKKEKEEVKGRRLNTTGFLFRSNLVSGWRGLEIKAFDGEGTKLPALRFERIDADIFLGIFNGNIASITITQPYEGLHFGIKYSNNKYQKNLKNEDGTNQKVKDGTADVDKELNEGLIENGILDISALAAIMKQKLINKKWMNTLGESKGKYFTSAEFAYQMVDSPVQRTISVNVLNVKNHG
ncbi:hypothetical protein [Flavobacterium poyangense]|uniref:hypothetical protein n=1 Tax=Flavobacterium poyangense TaxID=2204302 RepID=UPI001421CF4B|nr:hypothetical protein [Flavobacterium sp. JXAS1]